MQRLDLGAHLHAQLGVEVRQRFVKQNTCGSRTMARPIATALALAAESCAGRTIKIWRQARNLRRLD